MTKRILLGHLTILSAVAMGIGGTFLLDYLEKYTTHPIRLELIFAIAGGVLGFASIMASIASYTNNFGDGFKTK